MCRTCSQHRSPQIPRGKGDVSLHNCFSSVQKRHYIWRNSKKSRFWESRTDAKGQERHLPTCLWWWRQLYHAKNTWQSTPCKRTRVFYSHGSHRSVWRDEQRSKVLLEEVLWDAVASSTWRYCATILCWKQQFTSFGKISVGWSRAFTFTNSWRLTWIPSLLPEVGCLYCNHHNHR